MTDGRDRRVYPRAPIGIIVKVHMDSDSRSFYGKDISAGGIFLLAEKPPEIESVVEIEMNMPFDNATLHAKGEVVWIRHQDPSGFAIKFTDITESAQELIRWLVHSYLGKE